MTTPDVPLRLDLTYEVPGTPEQVWAAIATEAGIRSWFIPTDVDERLGGAICFHMGPDDASPGSITGWEPPLRVAYVEPEWATLAGQSSDAVTPLATEFLVEARAGGTCVVRVTSSAFGTGADWEQEFFDEMARGWDPHFETLRLYLTHFAGEEPALLEAYGTAAGPFDAVWAAMLAELGASDAGNRIEVRGYTGSIERVDHAPPAIVVVHVHDPVPGLLTMSAFPADDDETNVWVVGRFFAERAAEHASNEAPGWQAWIHRLAVGTP
jgi:uncharacterized protein YndB with AHSA1/START domain